MSLIALVASEFIRGLHDSISGVPAVRKIDALEAAKNEKILSSGINIHQVGSQPQSILARRRAQQNTQEMGSNADVIVISKKRDTIIERLINCCILNGGLCCAVLFVFNYIIHPCIAFVFTSMTGAREFPLWADAILLIINSLYFMPLLIASKIINLIWFQDIAEASYRKNRGRPKFLSSGKFIADISFSFFHQSLFILQAKLVCYIISVYCPFELLVDCILMLHMVPLYSLYAFEYRWFLMGWPVHKRLSYIELHWAYFLGFGFFLGLIMYFTSNSFFESSFLFALIFPLFIVSANEAKTMPQIIFPLPIFSPISRLTDATLIKCIEHSKELYPMIVIVFQFASGIIYTFYHSICQLLWSQKTSSTKLVNINDHDRYAQSSTYVAKIPENLNYDENILDSFEKELTQYLINDAHIENIDDILVQENDFIDAFDNVEDVKEESSVAIESIVDEENDESFNSDEDKESTVSDSEETRKLDLENVKSKSLNSYLIIATTLTLLFLALAIWLAVIEDAKDNKEELEIGKVKAESEFIDDQEIRQELLQPLTKDFNIKPGKEVVTDKLTQYVDDKISWSIENDELNKDRPMDTKIKKPTSNIVKDIILDNFIKKQFEIMNKDNKVIEKVEQDILLKTNNIEFTEENIVLEVNLNSDSRKSSYNVLNIKTEDESEISSSDIKIISTNETYIYSNNLVPIFEKSVTIQSTELAHASSTEKINEYKNSDISENNFIDRIKEITKAQIKNIEDITLTNKNEEFKKIKQDLTDLEDIYSKKEKVNPNHLLDSLILLNEYSAVDENTNSPDLISFDLLDVPLDLPTEQIESNNLDDLNNILPIVDKEIINEDLNPNKLDNKLKSNVLDNIVIKEDMLVNSNLKNVQTKVLDRQVMFKAKSVNNDLENFDTNYLNNQAMTDSIVLDHNLGNLILKDFNKRVEIDPIGMDNNYGKLEANELDNRVSNVNDNKNTLEEDLQDILYQKEPDILNDTLNITNEDDELKSKKVSISQIEKELINLNSDTHLNSLKDSSHLILKFNDNFNLDKESNKDIGQSIFKDKDKYAENVSHNEEDDTTFMESNKLKDYVQSEIVENSSELLADVCSSLSFMEILSDSKKNYQQTNNINNEVITSKNDRVGHIKTFTNLPNLHVHKDINSLKILSNFVIENILNEDGHLSKSIENVNIYNQNGAKLEGDPVNSMVEDDLIDEIKLSNNQEEKLVSEWQDNGVDDDYVDDDDDEIEKVHYSASQISGANKRKHSKRSDDYN